MKQCPTCKRTYADDGFTFCLADGALLSAPYDSEAKKPTSTIRSSAPPPTAVLPDHSEKPRVPPTIAAPPPDLEKPLARTDSDVTFSRKPTLRPIAWILFLGVPLLAAGVYFTSIGIQRSR